MPTMIPRIQKIGRLFKSYPLFLLPLLLLILSGCATTPAAPPRPEQAPPAAALPKRPAAAGKKAARHLGYAVQVGAFRKQENALHLAARLRAAGVNDVFSFVERGYYKVRFGNFASHEQARRAARDLKSRGLIATWFVVRPETYAARRYQGARLGEKIVATAAGFIGVPYRWGGTSARRGFDCSGLTMVVYRLNGIDLPRTSRRQFAGGRPVRRDDLLPGDLVFFDTNGHGRVSHVGIYTGRGLFIHAPRPGKKISRAHLDRGYFSRRYLGARRYF